MNKLSFTPTKKLSHQHQSHPTSHNQPNEKLSNQPNEKLSNQSTQKLSSTPTKKLSLYSRIGVSTLPNTTIKDYKLSQQRYVNNLKQAARDTSVNIRFFYNPIDKVPKPGDKASFTRAFSSSTLILHPDYDLIPATSPTQPQTQN